MTLLWHHDCQMAAILHYWTSPKLQESAKIERQVIIYRKKSTFSFQQRDFHLIEKKRPVKNLLA